MDFLNYLNVMAEDDDILESNAQALLPAAEDDSDGLLEQALPDNTFHIGNVYGVTDKTMPQNQDLRHFPRR